LPEKLHYKGDNFQPLLFFANMHNNIMHIENYEKLKILKIEKY